LGWSGGGLSALLFATQYTELVRNLVVWGVFSYLDKEDADMFECKDHLNWEIITYSNFL
jgi:pimeloyl-ACP methyl ester carboxylesterase